MKMIPIVRRPARLLTALFISSVLASAHPAAGQSLPVAGYEETLTTNISDKRPDPEKVAVTKGEAIRLAKEALPAVGKKSPDDIALVYSREGEYPLPIAVWRSAWEIPAKGMLAYAELDATTGDLLAFESGFLGNPKHEPHSAFPAGVTRSQAKTAAEAFVRKAVPSVRDFGLKELAFADEDSDYVYPLFGPARYSFRFGLTINGYEALNARILVVLDMAGNVKSFSFTGDPGQPVFKLVAVQANEAKRIWANGFRMMPMYRNLEDSYDKPARWGLTYEMDRTFWSLDAMSGTPVWANSDVYSYVASRRYESIPPTDVSFVPRSVDLEQAVQAVATIANFPKNTEWLSEDEANRGQRRTWELKGIAPGAEEGGHYSLTVDARTGQVLDYADYRDFGRDDSVQPAGLSSIQASDARKRAERWLAEHVPDFPSRYKLVAESEASEGAVSELTLEYQLFHDGIPIFGQVLVLELDGNGNMTKLKRSSESPADETLDALQPTLSAEQAKKLIVLGTKLQPYYLANKGYPFTYEEINPAERRLDLLYLAAPSNAYELYAPRSVDAVTGRVEQAYAWEYFAAGGPLPADAVSHPSKKALQTLFDRGMLLTDSKGRLLPDAGLSRGEFLRMMHKGMTFKGTPYIGREEPYFSDVGTKHPYFDDIVYFAERRWLTPNPKIALKADNPLTREQMAVWLTGIIGYEKLARTLKSDSQVTRLRDAGQIQDKGAAAVVLKLGLMKPVDGAFRPGRHVTKAEAAETLLKLAEIQSQLDRPLWTWGYGDNEYDY